MPSTASKSYKAGDVILDCKPLIHCVDNAFKGMHCDNCLKESDALKKCAKCHAMHYCGKECQQNDWKYHKNECKTYRHKNFSMERSTTSQRILLRLWLCIQSVPKFVSARHPSVDGKDVCLSEMKVDLRKVVKDKDKMDEFEVTLFNLKSCDLDVNRSQLLHWFALLNNRCAGLPLMCYTEEHVMIGSIKPVGFGVFIGLYELSHSCVPNASHISNGLSMQVRALKPIEANESLTITYTDLKLNKIERQRDLKQRFGFVCQCDKCRLNWDEDIDYGLLYCYLEECQDDYTAIRQELNDCRHSTVFHTHDYDINYNLLLLMRAIYGQYFPYLSQTMVLGFICFALSEWSDKSMVKLWYKEVENSLRVTHDAEHPLFRVFDKVYKEAMANKSY